MENLTMTEEELKAKIEEEVKKAISETTATLEKKHNEAMAQQRIKAKDEQDKAVQKAIADANLTAEQKAQKELEERMKANEVELAQLRLEKKINDRSKKLAEKGLPEFFKNDNRLLSAEDDKVDEVIETIKKEYSSVLPTGATINTNVSGGGTPTPDKFESFRNEGVRK